MIKSMTGFGSAEKECAGFGKVTVELRSANHKFFEPVFHLPEGCLALEEKLKRQLEAVISRGRVVCVVSMAGAQSAHLRVNQALLKEYLSAARTMKARFHLQDALRLDTLLHLPGVVALVPERFAGEGLWAGVKPTMLQARAKLEQARQKEGRALYAQLYALCMALHQDLVRIRLRFKQAVRTRLSQLSTDEERSSFLRDSDITEEIERLAFHFKNFKQKIGRRGPVGKELDFIAQEMQREANTLAAKSCDAAISSRIVQTKSKIEKIREQVQNIE